MMSGRDNKPHQISAMISDQEESPDSRIDSSTAHRQKSKRNISKRSKEGDDSLELKHRMINTRNQYFNDSDSRQESSATISRINSNIMNVASPRPSFTTFRLTFVGDETPSELSIIKDINKHCRISLAYGRYSEIGCKRCFS